MRKLILISLSFILIMSCKNKKEISKTEKLKDNQQIIWVNKFEVTCMGVGPMRCLEIQEGETLDAQPWKIIHSGIDGFTFESGKLQKLVVEKTELKPEEVPADATSTKITLIKVLEVREDKEDKLEGKWVITEIMSESSPEIENSRINIEIKEGAIGGYDGCNTIRGLFKNEYGSTFKIGPIMQTKRMCEEEIMNLSRSFTTQLESAYYYAIVDGNLHVENKEGIVILKFKRG